MAYTVKVAESSREFSKKEIVSLKQSASMIKLDEVAPVSIRPVAYAILDIHNDMLEKPDYKHIVLIDDDGTKYVTGSQTFMNNFKDIWSDLADEDDWELAIFKRDSKNYKGKQFLTCDVVI